jgi:ABC-type polysaccharide/polyol phosphate export permease
MNFNDYKLSKSMRLFFSVSGTVIWLGIWMTGFDVVHWILYIPAIFFAFAVITGICPGMIISKILMRDK